MELFCEKVVTEVSVLACFRFGTHSDNLTGVAL